MALPKSRNFKAERAARAASRNNQKENSLRPKPKLEPKFLYGHKVHFMSKEKRLKKQEKSLLLESRGCSSSIKKKTIP